jgi:hypothetical protein
MNPYENVNPAFLWLLQHPGLGVFVTFLWMLWVAGALGFISIQLYKHNEREELRTIMRKFEEEKRERERKANPVKSEAPQNPDSRYLPKS